MREACDWFCTVLGGCGDHTCIVSAEYFRGSALCPAVYPCRV